MISEELRSQQLQSFIVMAPKKLGHVETPATFLAALTLALHLVPTLFSSPNPVMPESSKLERRTPHDVVATEHPHRHRHEARKTAPRSFLDVQLAVAEEAVRVVRVRGDGAGDFRTVTDAVNSIPSGNRRRVVVWIGKGEYREKITVDGTRPFVTFYGETNGDDDDMPTITNDGTASRYGTVNSATVAVDSDYFVAVNVAFVNSSPMPDGKSDGAQAVAMRISGDKAAFYNCKFIGFQDTLCDDRGRHFFKGCYIQGTYDFIFGNGKSLYLRSTIESVAEGLGVITAQARESVAEDTGFTFLHCNITGSGNKNTYLGRDWKGSPRVVFAYTYMGSLINTRGWFRPHHHAQTQSNQTIFYGEYKCMGPGAASSDRVFDKILSDEEAKPFLSMAYIHGRKWVVPPPKL